MKFRALCFSAIAFGSLICHASPANSLDDWDFINIQTIGGFDEPSEYRIKKFNSATGSSKTISTKIFGIYKEEEDNIEYVGGLSGDSLYSAVTNRLHFGTGEGDYYYDFNNDTWGESDIGISDGMSMHNSTHFLTRHLATSDGTGEIHIGENSLITVEEDGRQKLYAKDVNGNAIPIDITEGSDLLINGTSVMGSIEENTEDIETNRQNISTNAGNIETNRKNINDLGYGVAGATALTAALSSLPTAADDTPFSCGVGTGGYSSRFAVGIGCASRLSDRLSVNVGGSHVFGGSSSYGGGSLGTVAARGGFVFKLGTIHKRSNIDGEELQSQLDEVRQENASIRQENKELLARLERLEAIALSQETQATKVSLKQSPEKNIYPAFN